MISYCASVIRPKFARMLIEELIRKTTVPYEILLWLNVEDLSFEIFLQEKVRQGVRLHIIGKTPENIGMAGFKTCFEKARGTIITQIDDDVIRVSPHMSEVAQIVFGRYPDIRHVSATLWEEDQYSRLSREPWESRHQLFDADLNLYTGAIDGWFSMYHRDLLPMLLSLPYGGRVTGIGYMIAQRLRSQGKTPVLCRTLKVFHVKGPVYLSYYDMLDVQVWKLKQLGQSDEAVARYAKAKEWVPSKEKLEPFIRHVYEEIDRPVPLPPEK